MLKSSAALGGEKGKKETLRKLRSVCARAYLMLITPFSGDVSHPGKPFKAEGAEKRGGGLGGVRVKGRGIWVKWCSPLLLHLSRNIKAPVMGTQVDSELFHSRLCPRPESMEPLILLRSASGREDVSYLPANIPLMYFIRRLRVLSVWVSRWSAGPLVPNVEERRRI